ncbi:Hypothetical predicted protein [Lecanosticta acicola]|uniref:DUF2241 domain-containing protein n=1 Tax=Lecanosticta acicola TaxID=111012 RepID=A0AAI8Z033_9PEZI|nr:Hypothetical predicted protein [Lecanosticta acicola]
MASSSSSSSSGTTNLRELIKSTTPILEPEQFVFAHLLADSSKLPDTFSRMSELNVKMLFREREAWTIILPQAVADREGLGYEFPCRQITLNIHSSLDAVGFIAAIAARLTRLSVGVNCVAAYYHDHLFIPTGREDSVVAELEAMASEQK